MDLVAGEWTKIKIEGQGQTARLYMHGANQPTLIVNDLKHGPTQGGSLGLWIGPGTDAHFVNLGKTPTTRYAKRAVLLQPGYHSDNIRVGSGPVCTIFNTCRLTHRAYA
ncbi:hypothetical protein IC229_22370 [Spirosoma sp. BT702]|uniref:Uncharacterized protein n=1 Tax=Spirosoma profusum TaxID=2771354 RepID=A0A927AS74_9BACT|nr:hypothetical protein [Spirosoma profusum]MBD2703406.1 hypothetical protein [Spirosoma profusum]